MARSLRVALLEPYYGGSHAAFVDTIARCSRHRCTLSTLPARKWKWRMRGASIWFGQNADQWLWAADGRAVDLILCNDMMSVADLQAMLPRHAQSTPIVCYHHENQLTYPIPHESERDYQYGMTNITSCLASDAVWFNSDFHRNEFLAAARRLLRKMPDHVPQGIVETIQAKSSVLYPPVSVLSDLPWPSPSERTNEPPTILWCHRWEYDKNPAPFFHALCRLDEAGIAFNLVCIGEQFRTAPSAFESVWSRLSSHIKHAGYIPDRDDYVSLLARCDIVVSTAIQENFGIAVVESILAGCQPLLPNRLAYPEIIPPEFHADCLYARDDDLYGRLQGLLRDEGRLAPARLAGLRASVGKRFGTAAAIGAIDQGLEQVAEATKGTQ